VERCEEVCLSKANEEHSLVSPNEHDESEVDPCDECVGVESVLARDVAETEDVQTRLPTTSCSIHGEKDGPCDADTYEGDDEQNFEEAEEKVAIEGVVVEDEFVGLCSVSRDPAEGSFLVIVDSVATSV
jgi:hypothetical protein